MAVIRSEMLAQIGMVQITVDAAEQITYEAIWTSEFRDKSRQGAGFCLVSLRKMADPATRGRPYSTSDTLVSERFR